MKNMPPRRLQSLKQAIGIVILALSQIAFAQIQEPQGLTFSKSTAAARQYNRYAYIDAIKTYERIAKKGYRSVDLFEKLGNAYYFNAKLAQANKWYGELMTMNQEVDPEYYYRYSQTLKSIGDYRAADAMLAKFNETSGNDQRAKLFEEEKDYLTTIQKNSGRYKIQILNINSELMDYGTTVYDNKLIFASSKEIPGYAKRHIKWNNQPFTNLYAAPINNDGTVGEPKLFSKKINLRYDEATPTFANDGKTVYFTRSNSFDSELGKDLKGTTGLKIYKATLEDGKWKESKALSINSDLYSAAHPALSPDGRTLYFASDMPGTLGDTDLFKATINTDGTMGTPVNLGKGINTPGRESFPFVSQDNELYFATDARQGLGGLDVYVSRINSNGTYSTPINIGGPVNSPVDDFAFYIDSKTKKGFFTSNRSTGLGYDDIYSLTETAKMKCSQQLSGVITDDGTKQIIPYARVVFLDSQMNEITQVLTNKKGEYTFEVACGEQYYVRTINQDYDVKEVKATIPSTSGKTIASIAVGKKIVELKEQDDIFVKMGINFIYFDLDKSVIRQDAALELEKILDVMKQYPAMTVDVRSHTDSRQTTKYNESLSDRRAKETIAWLVRNGISKDRLTGKGYGESQLVNKCADGATCTEAEHQANRRSEFIILKL